MVETMPEFITELYEMNLALHAMTVKEEWDEFIELASLYVMRKHDLADNCASTLSVTEKENLQNILKLMVDNEAEISRNLQSRLNTLKKNLSSLHHGAKCSQLYSLQQVSSVH